MRRTFRLLTVTGIMAGFTLSAMVSAQAADTKSIKDTKSGLVREAPRMQKAQINQKNALRKASVKSWKNYGPSRRSTSGKLYLGGHKAQYGDKQYFGDKFNSRGNGSDRYNRTSKYSGRYYRPTNDKSYNSFKPYRPGSMQVRRIETTPQCKHTASYSGHHKCCCCR